MRTFTLILAMMLSSLFMQAQTAQEHPLKNGETSPLRTTGVQVINIPQGWSSLSGYILPEDTDVETLFPDLIGVSTEFLKDYQKQ